MPSSQVFNLGNVIGAFGSTRARPVYKSTDINSYISGLLLPEYNKTMAANQADVANYANLIGAGMPQAQQFLGQDVSTLSNLINQYGSYDPTATYERLRSGNLESLNKEFTNLADYGSATDKARLAAAGLGDRASAGSYGKVLDQIRAARNITPVLGQIYGSLGSDTATIGNQRIQDLMAALGLMNTRAGLYDTRIAGRALMPAAARTAALGSDIASLGGIGGVYNQNLAGFESVPSGTARWGRAIGSIDEGLNSALDTYLSMYGGGALGGMGGGGGGGMGGLGGLFGGGGGGTGGSSNVNIAQLQQILSALGYGGGGGGAGVNYNPYGTYSLGL